MKIYIGKKGLEQTWQDEFPKETKCHKCKGNARVMFVGYEGTEEFKNKEKYVCQLHDNGKDDKYWPHDAIAIASYLCEKCFEVTSIINQA